MGKTVVENLFFQGMHEKQKKAFSFIEDLRGTIQLHTVQGSFSLVPE